MIGDPDDSSRPGPGRVIGDGVPEKIAELLGRLFLEELEQPHIVVCSAGSGVAPTFSGPYSSALEAMTAAEDERRREVAAGSHDLTFSVAPIYPAMEGFEDL